MSISFSPSQTSRLILILIEAEFMTGREYTSTGRKTLFEYYLKRNPRKSVGFPGLSATHEDLCVWREEDRRIEREFEAAIILTERAYSRFSRELVALEAGRNKLANVRMYRNLLVDTLAPFM